MSKIELTQEEKDLMIKNKQYIIDGDWDGFFKATSLDITPVYAFANVFQFCLECVPDLLYKITKIPDYAFFETKIKSITIPSNIKKIGACAFYRCESLTSITIPDSVTKVEDWAFAYCESLTNITIPNSVTEIETYAFHNCNSLKHISIPKHLDGEDFLEDLPEDCEIEVR